MDAVDRVEQWRQVSEHYRSLTDDELIAIARQKAELTDVAQQALDAEISYRKLEIPPEEPEEEPEVPVLPEPEPDSPYEAERELVEIETVYSLRDALQLQSLLMADGIPYYMGDEKATSAEAVKSNFAKGVAVRIMRIGLPFATRARIHYHPQDSPEPEEKEPDDAEPIFCPKCRSEAVVLEGTQPDATQTRTGTKFKWRCEACGKRWEDDGVVDEE
jgi:hypothetical protein